MSFSSDSSSLSVALGRLAVHQDYAWFVALLGWSLAVVVWRWHPRRHTAWAWLPWTALTGVLAAAMQFAIFNPPFDLFHDRLIPGTLFDYSSAVVTAELFGDLLLGFLAAVAAAGWWWRAPVSRRWPGWVAIATGVALYPLRPGWGSFLITASVLVALRPLWRLPEHSRGTRAALLLAAALPLLSTTGPMAAAIGMLQRSGPPTVLGLASALLQGVAAFVALAGLLHGALTSAGIGSLRELWRQAWALLLFTALWLSAGLVFAYQTGRDNRHELLQNRLRMTAARAMIFDATGLDQLARSNYGLPARDATENRAPYSPLLAGPLGQNLALQMIRERNATIYVDEARLLVIHDGWLMAVATSHPRHRPGAVELIRRATPRDFADWARRSNLVETSPVPEVGRPYFCRAPVLSADGRMLGWLDFSRQEFFQSLERKWRTGPLLVTALGLVLTAQWYLQRRGAREREAALRAAAVAAEANRLKTAFLAKVSHELRTPIQSLLGYGELLRTRVGDDLQARAWLGALQQHGEIMTRLVNDLLDLSAAESGSFRLVPRVVAPATIVRDIVASLEPRASGKGLRLHCHVTAAVPAWVEADGGRLGQVVLNLTGNALKFTDEGEVRVTLDASPAEEGRVRLEFTVRDTGPGIAPGEQAALFEPFSRLERTVAKEGSGLGLALSAALSRAMQGGITVESDGVHGSCFRAVWRVPLASTPEGAPAPAGDARNAPPRVLVVDDNTLVRELFVGFFSEHGCSCEAASQGHAAVSRARTMLPEVILLDLSLPDADGASLVPALREAAPGARIIGVSAHADGAERERALAAGMDAFFTKPVPLETLFRAVRAGGRGAAPYVVPRHLHAAFLRELPQMRIGLAAAVAAGDALQIRRRAHYLRNSALIVDARELLAACTALEDATTAPSSAALAKAWRQCEAAFARLAPEAGLDVPQST